MVGRLFTRIASPIRGLHEAAYVLALLTLASQALALLRDCTFAGVFGASHTLDLYYGAFRVPDLVFALVASLVSAYVLIPRIARAEREETLNLLSQSVSFLLLFGGGFCLILALIAPKFLFILYPSFASSPHVDAFIALTRLLLLQPLILGISGILTSVTQVHRRFILFALSPVLYNLGIIVGALVLYPHFGLIGIGWGVILGACLHASIHIPVLLDAGVFPRLTIPSLTLMKDIVRDSIPRSLALGMSSITLLALTALASRLSTGAVSVFTFGGNLEAVPLSLIGASYAVAAFPALSEHSGRDREAFTRILSASARHIILWSLVFMGFIVVLRAHLVRVILGAGAFDWEATRLTAAILAILTVGLVAQGLVLLFSRALYAARQSWRPFFYQAAGGLFTFFIALAFVKTIPPGSAFMAWFTNLLRVGDLSENTSVLLLALASTLGQILLAIGSVLALHQVAPGLSQTLARPLRDGLAAAVSGGAVIYGALYLLGGFAPLTTLLAVFTQGLIAGIVGLAASGLVLHVLRNDEFRDFMGALTRLVGAKKVLPPSAEEPAQP